MSPVHAAPSRLTAGADGLRARYLHEVLPLLYPAVDHEAGTEFVVVPDARRPRLLVPAGSARVAAAAVRRYSEPQGWTARRKRDAVVAALRTRASGLLLRDRVTVGLAGSVQEYLRQALDTDLVVSVHIGPARANRKPVLQLLAPDGDTIGFAKLGVNELTRTLVRAETSALRALAGLPLTHTVVPQVLHAGVWRDHDVLVQSPLPIWLPRHAAHADLRLASAMREIATGCGTHRGPVDGSRYAAHLRARLAALATSDDGKVLGEAAQRLLDTVAGTTLTFGAWHGDWAPWNMAVVRDGVLVWDWERFGTGVPVGFDPLHHRLQRAVVTGGMDPKAAVDDVVSRAAAILAPYEVAEAEVTALLYLVDLAARYLTDRQAEAGARLGVLGTWLLPVLVNRVERLS